MTQKHRDDIVKIGKEFTDGFKPDIDSINESEWLIVDPLSAYLSVLGYENTLKQLPETEHSPMVLVMTFKDGSQLIPAGSDLKYIDEKMENWMWL